MRDGKIIITERRAAWLRGFEESGLSLAEFCRREGLAYSTVLNWRRQAREAASAPVSPAFVVVEALPPEPEHEHEPPAVPVMDERGERTVAAEGFDTEDAGGEAGAGRPGQRAGPPGTVARRNPRRCWWSCCCREEWCCGFSPVRATAAAGVAEAPGVRNGPP